MSRHWAGCAIALVVAVAPRPSAASGFRFDFGPGAAEPGHVRVAPDMTFDAKRGYGFEPGAKVDGPFSFSVAVPEGNYRVTVAFGDRDGPSDTTVKAESRRLMLERARTEPGRFVTRTFVVNARTPRIVGGGRVRLKGREEGAPDWDDKLTLEFLGDRPRVRSLKVAPAEGVVTVYLLGDSTVTDQPREPWSSWGQMLPRFFNARVAVANHAESGESLKSSLGARRLDKVLGAIRPGDYLFIQFGHNDQKERGPGVGAFTTYRASLAHYIAEARRRGATPVLITPVNRRTFGPDGKVTNSLGDYPEAVRREAREADATLIDLNAMSKPLYEALGPAGSAAAFVDGTHHNNYGSYELARCVVEGIRKSGLGLAQELADDVPPFDPGHPDRPEDFAVPASPARSATKPDGN